MKQKYEPNKRKAIDERKTKKNYSGEASPYWDFINRHNDGEEDRPLEHPLANPDVYPEEKGLYNRPLTEQGELQLEVVREIMPTLTLLQQRILTICGFDGRPEDQAAIMLGIKRRTLRTILSRVRQKIKRKYEQRKLSVANGVENRPIKEIL